MTDTTSDDDADHANAARRAVYSAKGKRAAVVSKLGGATNMHRQAPIGPHNMTPRQMKFFEGLITGKTQADAYRDAYDTSNMTDKSIAIAAHHTKMHRNVQSAIMEWRHECGARMKFTTENLSHMMIETFETALNSGNAGQMTGAVALLAKLNGLVVERSERRVETIDGKNREALLGEVRRLSAALGLRIVDVTPSQEVDQTAAAALPTPPAIDIQPMNNDVVQDTDDC